MGTWWVRSLHGEVGHAHSLQVGFRHGDTDLRSSPDKVNCRKGESSGCAFGSTWGPRVPTFSVFVGDPAVVVEIITRFGGFRLGPKFDPSTRAVIALGARVDR